MRAARAAKGSFVGGSGPTLAGAIGESQGSAVEYLLQHLLPLLKPLVDELCLREPHRRSTLLAVWLLERAGAPQHVLAELRSMCEEEHCPEKHHRASTLHRHIASGELVPRKPPGDRPSLCESPKKKAAHIIREGETGAQSPTSEHRDPAEAATPEAEATAAAPGVATAAAPVAEAAKKRVSIWQGVKQDSDEDSDDMELPAKEAEQTDYLSRGRASLLSSPSAAQRKEKNSTNKAPAHQNTRKSDDTAPSGARRRFTVHLAKCRMDMPPESEVEALLRKVPAFSTLPPEEMEKVIGITKCNKYESEENLVAHGCVAEEIHIIVDGVGKVSVPYQIASYSRGDFFGEEALRLAAATSQVQVAAATGPITTISVNGAAFQMLDIKKTHVAKQSQLKRERLKGMNNVEAGSLETARQAGICPDSGLPVILDYHPSPSDRDVIIMSIRNNKMLGGVLELTEQQCSLIADSVYLVKLKCGQTLMSQGDAGTALYIVQEGILDVTLEHGDQVKFRTGDSFGELALLYDTPRAATIAAAKDCLLWVLTRPDYKLITSLAYKARIEEFSQMLARIPSLAKMVNATHMDMLADVLEKVTFYDEEEVCCEGEDEGMLFIIYDGECEMLVDGEVQRTLVKGDWVGEEQVISGSCAQVTVKPTEDAVTALVLDTHSLVTVVKVQTEMQKSSDWTSKSDNMKQVASHRPSLAVNNQHLDHVAKNEFADDFLRKRMGKQVNRMKNTGLGVLEEDSPEDNIANMKRIAVLGEGTFGSVVLMEDQDCKKMYALKALSKEHITEEKMGPMVVNERNIQLMLDSDFIVKLYQTYQDCHFLYFLLEPVLGGELFDIYNDNDLWGKIPEAKFYIACVILGLQHMHAKRVVYRDLKLENCILEERGYLKLTDMGIAKVVMGKTYTVCGTADYFAPETLRQSGHDRAVDWWAAGVLLFIMMTGHSPFDAPQVTQIYKNIMKGFSKVSFPGNVPSDCIEVIKSLCRKKPEERVAMQKGGVATLQEMGFFSGLSWDDLQSKTSDPPLVPPKFEVERLTKKTLTRELNLDVDDLFDWDGSLPELTQA